MLGIPFLLNMHNLSIVEEHLCQCPNSGLLHFYKNVFLNWVKEKMCQCPNSGLLHFYDNVIRERILFQHVSMPYHGPTPFLHPEPPVDPEPPVAVSMPYHGPTPFLRDYGQYNQYPFISVNALPRAYSISTSITGKCVFIQHGVSMPYLGPTPSPLYFIIL